MAIDTEMFKPLRANVHEPDQVSLAGGEAEFGEPSAVVTYARG